MALTMKKTKHKILDMLLKHPDIHLSGQKICDVLGCSRTAVWKHIKELESEGFKIEAIQKKGYRLLSTPNELSEARILVGLKTKELGQHLIYFDSIGSTQKETQHLAEDGAPHGTLVITSHQMTGRGRLGRTWSMPKGKGIAMSLILRPKLSINRIPQLTLIAAVAVYKAITEVTGIQTDIKWPNDILVMGKKIVGILTEMQTEGTNVKAVIIGMGMNINANKNDFPEEIRHVATSLKTLTGKEHDMSLIVQTILFYFEELYLRYLEEGFSVIKWMWESHAVSIGKRINARLFNGKVLTGLAKGIDEEGALLLEDDQGSIHKIYSADIEIE